jgi:DNA polymerase-4
VRPDREAKSISAETTFDHDVADFRPLELRLWQLCEKVSSRLKHSALAGASVTLKLKTADFRIRTRARSLPHPTQLAARIFCTGRDLLADKVDGTKFRLIGVGVSTLCAADGADFADFIDRRAAEAEQAIDRLREKFGNQVVIKGLAFEPEDGEQTLEDGCRASDLCRLSSVIGTACCP